MPTILVVEDDVAIRQGLEDAFADEGYTVKLVRDGNEAWQFLHTETLPDLIVLDLMLPGMSGQQFRVRQVGDPNLRHIPVIVLSALPFVEGIGTSLGAHASLAKPIQLDQLLATVEQILQQ